MTRQPAAASAPEVTSASVAERYRPAILRYVLRLVRHPAQAQDLTQETFLRVHERLGGLHDLGALEGWLYRTATNVCYDWFRRAAQRRQTGPLTFGDEGSSVDPPLADEATLRPDQMLEQNAMSECVLRFLTRLPVQYRTVLLLHDLQGYTDAEIAVQAGLSLENVKVRLHRARVKLKTALAGGCEFSHNDRGILVCHPKPAAP